MKPQLRGSAPVISSAVDPVLTKNVIVADRGPRGHCCLDPGVALASLPSRIPFSARPSCFLSGLSNSPPVVLFLCPLARPGTLPSSLSALGSIAIAFLPLVTGQFPVGATLAAYSPYVRPRRILMQPSNRSLVSRSRPVSFAD